MGECWSRASRGQSPFVEDVDAAPTKCSCGRFGVFYAVFGNIHFGIILIATVLYGPIWFAASKGNPKNLFALFTSLIIGAILLIRRLLRNPSPAIALGLNVALVLLMSLTILPFFLAVGPVVVANNRRTYDRNLVAVDKALLGWLYMEGQMSLSLDRSPSLNPTTGFGRFYVDLLQIFYVTYYAWGYLPIILVGIRYIKAWRSNDGDTVNRSLAQIKLYMTGWLSAFILVFICNTTFPALSPRLYFAGRPNNKIFSPIGYIHPRLEGFGLAKLLIGVATDNTSFGSFPSGHYGESLVAGIYLWHINRIWGAIALFSTFMIALATQALRYHYFADLLGATFIAIISLGFGFCISGGVFKRETARIAASYATHSGLPSYIERHDEELQVRSTDDSSLDIDFDNKSTASSEVDLELGGPSDLGSVQLNAPHVNTFI